ncbi:MAG TPA: bifunctional UDP-sugar hydrolase/5'-nucleotidase [Bacillales bacterium]|nr:bifunctional UDP-sugar hydrolase/5'-nucleotidase [Bacillales bacterium]
MLKTFRIFHTNDIHSHFSHWPQIAAYFNDAREQCKLMGEPYLLFDIGDHIDRFHPMTEGTRGKGNVQLLNALGYNAVTIGNNEGVTLSKNQLAALYEDAHFPVLTANLYDKEGKRAVSMQPYEFFELENGLTVAAIGLTVPFKDFYEPLGWKVDHPYDLLSDLIQNVREKADVVVLLSHLGYSRDLEIADEWDGIDLILGAHSHHLLEHGERVKETTILQAGKYGDYVGETKITYDTQTKRVTECVAESIAIEDYRKDRDTEKLLDSLVDEGVSKLQSPIVTLNKPLEADWFKPASFTKVLAEALREWCEAEIGMANSGLLLESLPAGPVKRSDLHRVCPHPINPCKLKLTGRELMDVVELSMTEEIRNKKIKGLGFRGKVLGAFIYDGIEIKADNGKIKSIEVGGTPLQLESEYEVATLDMFTFGMIFPEFAKKKKQYFLPEMLRDVLAWKLAKLGTPSSTPT